MIDFGCCECMCMCFTNDFEMGKSGTELMVRIKLLQDKALYNKD